MVELASAVASAESSGKFTALDKKFPFLLLPVVDFVRDGRSYSVGLDRRGSFEVVSVFRDGTFESEGPASAFDFTRSTFTVGMLHAALEALPGRLAAANRGPGGVVDLMLTHDD